MRRRGGNVNVRPFPARGARSSGLGSGLETLQRRSRSDRLRRKPSPAAAVKLVPARAGRGELKEKASRFLALASPIEDPDKAAQAVEELRREYHDATHVAFAWKMGVGHAARSRASDAGEPSGTAGKPILAAIESAGVTDVLVAVVRYYGGTKLGTGGLARAYREAAARALASAGGSEALETVGIEVRCSFESVGAARRLLGLPGVALLEERIAGDCLLRLSVLRSQAARVLAALSEARLSHRILDKT
ncbi:MAG TPA: YigZ family protein [Thermoanaerobaculia bacterium]|nr:YigZ family protein [Thermoanaerobaculia bacterium]